MHHRIRLRASLLAALGVVIGVCAAHEAAGGAPQAGGMTPPDAHTALPGTAWQLVGIVSMDDRVYGPDNRARYTLVLNADGSMRVRADCNLGTGSWTSDAAGRMEFGVIAATQALCPPGSLHDRYLAQFPLVGSYVVKEGHLFLSTTADGSIMELEPMELPPAATVLGEEVRTGDARDMQELVLGRLFDRYADEHGIEAADAEIDAYVEKMRRGLRAEGVTPEEGLTPEEAVQSERMQREMARSLIRQWKLNRLLHQQYGGRIIFQQLGPEPIDAYRRFLEECRAAGDFTIHDKAFEEGFWGYFVDDTRHDFYPPGSAEEARAFASPPWSDTP